MLDDFDFAFDGPDLDGIEGDFGLDDVGNALADVVDFDLGFDGDGLGSFGGLRLHSPFGEGDGVGFVDVDAHIRTIADAFEENNFSFDGTGSDSPSPDVTHVSDHLRTYPDGFEGNNLSFDG